MTSGNGPKGGRSWPAKSVPSHIPIPHPSHTIPPLFSSLAWYLLLLHRLNPSPGFQPYAHYGRVIPGWAWGKLVADQSASTYEQEEEWTCVTNCPAVNDPLTVWQTLPSPPCRISPGKLTR